MSELSDKNQGKFSRFYNELKRRHVFGVGAAYLFAGWLLIQASSIVLPAFNSPPIILQAVIGVTITGFPIALILAWIYELTRKGVVRTNELDKAKARTYSDRRQMTVLYGRFQWTGNSIDDVDPEFLKKTLPDLREICASNASKFMGHLVSVLTDEFTIYFGYPEAHEHDAKHAVSAGLNLLHDVQKLSDQLRDDSGTGISVSIGIDTGIAVVEDSEEPNENFQVLAAMASVAEWLESFVEFGQLGISQRTAELVRGYFELIDLGEHKRPRGGKKISVYKVTKTSGAKTRIQARGNLASLTGRDLEFATMKQRWEQTLSGHGQVVLITGEAGLGKSRLIHELKTHVQTNANAWITECFCSPEHSNRALYPAATMIHQQLITDVGELEDSERLNKLVLLLDKLEFELATTVPLLATLLNIPYQDSYPDLHLSPKLHREKTMEALLQLLFARAERHPLLLVIEDLHWADPSFLELVLNIVEQGPSGRILVVCTVRPDTVIEWNHRTHVTQISLTPLSVNDTKSMIASISSENKLPTTVLDELVTNAQGNPLFAEELTRNILDSIKTNKHNASSVQDLHIPATLQESLLARLDRLAPKTKTVARLAATLGREFSYSLAESFAKSLGIDDIQDDLRTLVSADVLYQRGISSNTKYIFKHVLFQESAYQSLLKSEREDYHARIANLLSENWPDICTRHPEQLARHQEAAGLTREAIMNWTKAGQAASKQSALIEASRYLQHALKSLKRLPPSSDRDQAELDLQITLGPALMAVHGYSAQSVLNAYQRAEELCDAHEASPKIAAVLFGLWAYSVVSGALMNALRLGDRLLEIANRSQNEDLLIESNLLLGVTKTYTGPMSEAYDHLTIAEKLYKHDKHQGHAFVYGQNPYMASLSYSALSRWWLGNSDEGGKLADKAIEFARGINHPRSLAFALANGARCHLKRGDFERTVETGQEAAAVSDQYGFPDFSAMGKFHQRAAEFRLNENDETLRLMELSLGDLMHVGNSVSMPFYHCVMADCLSKRGQFENAKQHISQAQNALNKHEMDTDEAEFYRVKGLVSLREAKQTGDESDVAEAQKWLEHAVTVATEQGAISWQQQAVSTLT